MCHTERCDAAKTALIILNSTMMCVYLRNLPCRWHNWYCLWYVCIAGKEFDQKKGCDTHSIKKFKINRPFRSREMIVYTAFLRILWKKNTHEWKKIEKIFVKSTKIRRQNMICTHSHMHICECFSTLCVQLFKKKREVKTLVHFRLLWL